MAGEVFVELRRRRLKRKMTIGALAHAVGVSPLTVRFWERGLSTPSPENQAKIESLFGVKWDTLKKAADGAA